MKMYLLNTSYIIVFLSLGEYTNGCSEPKLVPGFECVEIQWEFLRMSTHSPSKLTEKELCLLLLREKCETLFLELVCLNMQRYSTFCLKEIHS